MGAQGPAVGSDKHSSSESCVQCIQAYFGNLNAHACQRYSFLQAQERYKERASKNPLAGMVFRQVLPTLLPFLSDSSSAF